ncbi:antA/AntB antirepressor family protein [Fibrella forsythiae]|uniref:AntA/AntB antirepressor family protein n=1 Tax=Fibrella forsythiae TaxID=2817061 RepID=A0ABS3JBC4_9BACT|nr:antA/AntB antirepressor family protein [Fibrella forsythiae]MBO0947274.1 antA/AntB antirepressor family protein [Fibrella forsythiae]
MNELIQITTNEQGSSVVSARELYESLGFSGAVFARWAKKNIVNNPFSIQGVDWEQLNIMLSRGNGAQVEGVDYALSTDFAERLCMLARTEKGEEVRRWFQAIKNKAMQAPAIASTETLLLQLAQQQAQLLTNQQSQLDQLRSDMGKIQAGIRPARARSAQLPLPPMRPAKDEALRQRINQRVNEYCDRYGYTQSETYRYLYKCMQSNWGINVYQYPRRNGESLIDLVERYGYLHKLYSVVMAEIDFVE